MKVLVIGSGGREHAIVRAISRSKKVSKIYCAPGNAGISELAEIVDIKVMEFDKLADFAESHDIADHRILIALHSVGHKGCIHDGIHILIFYPLAFLNSQILHNHLFINCFLSIFDIFESFS